MSTRHIRSVAGVMLVMIAIAGCDDEYEFRDVPPVPQVDITGQPVVVSAQVSAIAPVGDVNGDGFHDLQVVVANTNRRFIIFGRASFGGGIDLETDPNVVRLLPDDASAPYGVGDVNADGFDDVFVPGEGYWVVYGRADFAQSGAIDLETATLPVASQVTSTQFDYFHTVAVGDFNGDGIGDLGFIQRWGGERLIVRFGEAALPAIIDSDNPGSNSVTLTGLNIGNAYLLGDVNDDGIADVVIDFSTSLWGLFLGRSSYPLSLDITGELIDVEPGSPLSCIGDLDGNGYTDFCYKTNILNVASDRLVLNMGAIAVIERDNPASEPFVNFEAKWTPVGDRNGDGFDDLLFMKRDDNSFDFTHYEIRGGPKWRDIAHYDPNNHSWKFTDFWTTRFGLTAKYDPPFSAFSGVGDFDGDGRIDLVCVAGNAVNVMPNTGPRRLAVRHRAGNPAPKAVGVVGTGELRDSPVARAWIDFADGHGPTGVDDPSTTWVERGARGDVGTLPGGRTLADAADVRWEVSTDRANATTVTLTFKYLDSEIAGLNEAGLQVYRSADSAGPWSVVAGATLEPARNRIRVTVPASELGHFILLD